MKRSTLALLLLAALGAVMVYYLEIKDAKPRDEQPESSKPAFSFKREDLASVSITHSATGAGETILLEQQDGKWVIKQPISATANESAVDTLISDIVNARIERTITASPEEIKSFGLTEPAINISLKLKSGPEHRLRLGTKDFTNLSVYGLVDDTREVALLPATLAAGAEKSVNELRDLSILGGLSQFDISSLTVKNSNGGFALAKENSEWIVKSPFQGAADETQVSSLLSDVTSARATEVATEKADDLTVYGLTQPAIVVTARLEAGGERQISIGSTTDKTGKNYYAKSSDRGQVFKIDDSLFEKLDLKPAQLRSKQILKLDQATLTKVQLKNPNMTLVVEKNAEGKWLIREPADQKDKEAQTTRFLDPLASAKATEVLDKPSAAIAAKFAKPAVEIRLIGKDGKTITVRVSSADGEDAYARVDGRPEVFKVGKQLLDELSFKATDIAP
ncbi:MAG: DUF4340 domain-containing protein [Acidobacteriota bacterium]